MPVKFNPSVHAITSCDPFTREHLAAIQKPPVSPGPSHLDVRSRMTPPCPHLGGIAQIAAFDGITVGTAYRRVRVARARLRVAVKDQGKPLSGGG